MEFLPLYLLLLVVPVVFAVAYKAPIHWLILLDIIGVLLSGEWQIGGIRFGPSDVVLAAIAFRLYRKRRAIFGKNRPKFPYATLLIALGVTLSIAHLTSPLVQGYLTNPARFGYQIYRYCLRTVAYYPLAVILLSDKQRFKSALIAYWVAGLLCGAIAIPQGYAGQRAPGPFTNANALGTVLILPVLVCVLFMILPAPRRRVYLLFASLLVLLRALLFTQSRGAQVASAVAVTVLMWALLKIPLTRTRLRRFMLAIPLLLIGLFVLVPDILERPHIQKMLSVTSGTGDSTMRWRMEKRWPHFWRIAIEHPWLGTGTEVDPSLGRAGNTPHNGYLALAVKSGFPVLGMYVLAAILGLRDGYTVFRRARDPELRALGAFAAAAILAILVHNSVDSIFMNAFMRNAFWVMVAFSAVSARRLRTTSPYPVASRAPGSAQRGYQAPPSPEHHCRPR